MSLSVEAIAQRARRLARSEDLWGDSWEPAARALFGAIEAEAHPSPIVPTPPLSRWSTTS
jgi:hypothetical protein